MADLADSKRARFGNGVDTSRESRLVAEFDSDRAPDVTFQILDIKYLLEANANAPAGTGPLPVVHLIGRTSAADGSKDVLCRVHDFEPYFYCMPRNDTICVDAVNSDHLLNRLNDLTRHNGCAAVKRVELVEREPLYNYKGKTANRKRPMFLVTCAQPSFVSKCKEFLHAGIVIGDGLFGKFDVFEANVDFILRFNIDLGIPGCGWVTCPADSLHHRVTHEKVSRCAIEFDMSCKDLKPRPEINASAPFVILSLDIECVAKGSHFPKSSTDPICQISLVLSKIGKAELDSKHLLTVGDCAPIDDVNLICCANEADLLNRFFDFIVTNNPDFLATFNGDSFDLTYIFARASLLQIPTAKQRCGRLHRQDVTCTIRQMQTNASGQRDMYSWNFWGRMSFDTRTYMLKYQKMSQYSLEAAADTFLDRHKEDVPHFLIAKLFDGSSEDRARLGRYCVQDSVLVAALIDKLKMIYLYLSLAVVTKVPFDLLMSRGQQIQSATGIRELARRDDIVTPTFETQKEGENEDDDLSDLSDSEETPSPPKNALSSLGKPKPGASAKSPVANGGRAGPEYEGATVLAPRIGFYTDPVVTLDFSSLYPSIIRSNNLCYTTFVPPELHHEFLPEGVSSVSELGDSADLPDARVFLGHMFVKKHIRAGIVPALCERFVTARKGVRKLMETISESVASITQKLDESQDNVRKLEFQESIKQLGLELQVLDSQQLAYKLCGNSTYGFLGAKKGSMPFVIVALVVTFIGRRSIGEVKDYLEKHYPNMLVIYGDTDSVFIVLRDVTVEQALEIGKSLAKEVTTALFSNLHPMQLEFEKVLCPLILIKKKTYVGRMFTSADSSKFLAKGVEIVRRNSCKFVTETMKSAALRILMENDLEGSLSLIRAAVTSLLRSEVSISKLILTGSYSRLEYSSKGNVPAHVVLARRIAKEDPGLAPLLGDRIPYVMRNDAKNAKSGEMAEDPLRMITDNIPVNTRFYMERLMTAMSRLLDPVIGADKVKLLFSGDHTRVSVAKSVLNLNVNTKSYGIAKFAKPLLQCLVCGTSIPAEEKSALCIDCMQGTPLGGLAEFKLRKAVKDESETEFKKCCEVCVSTCENHDNQETFACRTTECDNLFKRHEEYRKLQLATHALKRFTLSSW